MKKLAFLTLFGALLAVLSGCAMNGETMKGEAMHSGVMQDEATVKCPACGFEFNTRSDA